MKGLLTGVLAAILLTGAARAERSLVRVHLEYIEVAQQQLTELLASAQADAGGWVHARMRELVKEGKAKILESCVLVSQPGQKALVESIREYIYPTEWEPGGLGDPLPAVPASGVFSFPNQARPTAWAMQHFETRNVGVTLEIEPTIWRGTPVIDLRLAPEIVNPVRLDTWVEHRDQWGAAPLVTPVFESLRMSTGITLANGKFAMLGTLTPTKAGGGPAPERKLVLFVRADILSLELPGGKAEEE